MNLITDMLVNLVLRLHEVTAQYAAAQAFVERLLMEK